MLLKKWEQVYNELQKRAEPLAYSPPLQLGSGTSQVFEFKVRREPVLLLAFRDLARKEDYKVANRLWAEGLDLVLERYDQLAEQGKPAPRAAAIVIDNKSDTFIVVMMDELLSLYRQKGALRRERWSSPSSLCSAARWQSVLTTNAVWSATRSYDKC